MTFVQSFGKDVEVVVTQMLLNLIVFGVVIRLLASAARRGVARRGGQTSLTDLRPPGN